MIWINKSIMTSSHYIGLCTSPRQFEIELKRLKVLPSKWPEFTKTKTSACVHFLQKNDSKKIAIVCIYKNSERKYIETVGLIVHEACHIWQAICREIGELEPSNEFEAYAIQHIAQGLLKAYKL